jgi:hypothetical protein
MNVFKPIMGMVYLLLLWAGHACAERGQLFPQRSITSEVRQLVKERSGNLLDDYNSSRFDSLYKNEQREVGNTILDLVIFVWVDNEPTIKSLLWDWCRLAIAKDPWGNNLDLEISHLLFGLSVAYDWHKDSMPDDLRKGIRKFIYQHVRTQFAFAKLQAGWWTRSYWQNHCWINYTSILASGLALSEDYAEAEEWVQFAGRQIKTMVAVQPPYGSNQEGLNYSVYGNLWLVRALTILEDRGEDLFAQSKYLKEYYKYYQAFAVNENLDIFFDVGDSPRSLWYSPAEIFVKLAQKYNSQEYKDLGLFYRFKIKKPKAGLMSAVYQLPPQKQSLNLWDKNPVSVYIQDIGVYSEKIWKDNAVVGSFFFKSGIAGGRWAHEMSAKDPSLRLNRSHSHPDQNHFIVWTPKGFLISDTGNSKKPKSTAGHNTLLVDGQGQLGEGEKWFKEKNLEGRSFSSVAGLTENNIFQIPEITIVGADAAAFYPSSIDLKKFDRTIVWIKPIGFIIIDAVGLNAAHTASVIFHSDFDYKPGENKKYWIVNADRSIAQFIRLWPDNPSVEIKKHTEVLKHEQVPKGEFLTISQPLNSSGYFINAIVTDALPAALSFQMGEGELFVELHRDGKKYKIFYNDTDTEIVHDDYSTDAKITVVISENAQKTKIIIFSATYFMYGQVALWKSNEKANGEVEI